MDNEKKPDEEKELTNCDFCNECSECMDGVCETCIAIRESSKPVFNKSFDSILGAK